MTTVTHFLGADHKRCDDFFVEAERLAATGDFSAARTATRAFLDAMARHFAMEEEILFPTFEAATGQRSGPTAVMRHEHQQMRELFGELESALARGDADHFLGGCETLLILMQQHNAKEEQILYPMSDRVLAAAQVVARMEALHP